MGNQIIPALALRSDSEIDHILSPDRCSIPNGLSRFRTSAVNPSTEYARFSRFRFGTIIA